MSRRFRSAAARKAAEPDALDLAGKRQSYQSGRAMRYLLRPLLIALLITALASGSIALIRSVSGDTRWSTMLIVFFLVTLEGIYTTNWLQRPAQMALDRTIYRAAELLLLILAVRLGTWAVFAEGWPDQAALVSYLLNPAPLFLDATFLIATAVALLMWRLGVLLSGLFTDLEVSEFELRYYSLPLAQRKAQADDQPIRQGRSESVRHFARYWLWGGIFLVVTTAISRLDGGTWQETLLAPLATGRASLQPGLLAALLIYFLVGLWLLSQARLLEMDARWLLNGVNKDAAMRSTWQRTSLAILAGMALIAAFLPIGSTSALSQIVNAILFGLLFLVNILVFALTLPFALILALLSRGSGSETLPQPLPDPQLPPLPPPEAIAPASQTITLVLSSAFWTVLLAGAVLALLYFLRERRRREEGEEPEQLWAAFRAWLAALWLRLRGRLAVPLVALPARESAAAQPLSIRQRLRRRWRSLEGLTAREQVRLFYLMAVQRAAEEGVPREPAETPGEFVRDLQEAWPEASAELDRLTEAFVQARYSDEAIDDSRVPEIKQVWQSVQEQMTRKAGDAESLVESEEEAS